MKSKVYFPKNINSSLKNELDLCVLSINIDNKIYTIERKKTGCENNSNSMIQLILNLKSTVYIDDRYIYR